MTEEEKKREYLKELKAAQDTVEEKVLGSVDAKFAEYEKARNALNEKVGTLHEDIKAIKEAISNPKPEQIKSTEEVLDTVDDVKRKALSQWTGLILKHQESRLERMGIPESRRKEIINSNIRCKAIGDAYKVSQISHGGVIPIPTTVMPIFLSSFHEPGTVIGDCYHQASNKGKTSAPSYTYSAIPTEIFDMQQVMTASPTEIKFSAREMTPELFSKLVPISKFIFDVPGSDVGAIILNAYRRIFREYFELLAWEGTGVGGPLGLKTNKISIPTFNQGHATELQAKGLRKAQFHVKSVYRKGLKWRFNATTMGDISALCEETDGAFRNMLMILPGENTFRIDGIPATVDPHLPNATSASRPGLLADMSQLYCWLDVMEGMTITIDETSLMDQHVVRYLFDQYVGGSPMVDEAGLWLVMAA